MENVKEEKGMTIMKKGKQKKTGTITMVYKDPFGWKNEKMRE